MEQIVMSLALDYARARGLTEITDKALDYAYEKLGIQEEEDDEYTVEGIYGMKNAFNTKTDEYDGFSKKYNNAARTKTT